MDEAHEDVTDFGTALGFEEVGILSVQNRISLRFVRTHCCRAERPPHARIGLEHANAFACT